jgi:hypothetical protein
MAIMMVHANRLSARSIQQVRELEAERTRPRVSVGLEFHRGSAIAVARNTGLRSALDVVATLEPDISKRTPKGLEPVSLLHDTMPCLAPGQVLEELVGPSEELISRCGSVTFSGQLQYRDSQDTEYTEALSIDLSRVAAVQNASSYSIAERISDVAEELKKLAARTPR